MKVGSKREFKGKVGIDYGGPGRPEPVHFGLDINWEPLQHFRKGNYVIWPAKGNMNSSWKE